MATNGKGKFFIVKLIQALLHRRQAEFMTVNLGRPAQVKEGSKSRYVSGKVIEGRLAGTWVGLVFPTSAPLITGALLRLAGVPVKRNSGQPTFLVNWAEQRYSRRLGEAARVKIPVSRGWKTPPPK